MEERLKQVEDAVGAISVLLLDYMGAMEEAGCGDSMGLLNLKDRAQRLVGEYLDSVLAQEAERIGAEFEDKDEE